MSGARPPSFPSIVLAVAGAIVIGIASNQWLLAIGVMAVWTGSLFLLSSQPPEITKSEPSKVFSSANMAELIEYSGTPILVTEAGRISAANRAARKLLGNHVIGQDMRVALRHPKAIQLLESHNSGFTQIKGLSRRRDVWRLNKQVLSNSISVVELLNQTSEVDIGRAHTDFVANASHELRTPLASIIGYVETMLEEDSALPDEMQEKFLGTILAEGKRLQNLVSDLMSLSRIEAEKHEQPQDLVEFDALVGRAARDAAGVDCVDRLKLVLVKGVRISGDERQLEQLVRNLVDNGLKYGAVDGEVTIRLHINDNDEAELSVSDSGDGIPPEHIPYLTQRFYRTDPGRSRASGGTGLGLAIVKHIVERHRGRLDISSQLGQGTTISVRIPLLRHTKD